MRKRLLLWLANKSSVVLSTDRISRNLRCSLYRAAGVEIGEKVILLDDCSILGANLKIGAHCAINAGCYFDLTGDIVIEEHVGIGHRVTFVTAEHVIGPPQHRAGPISSKPIFVGRGAWIGANATIFPGVSIGAGAVIAACSVVTKSIPANKLAAGMPARVIQSLDLPGTVESVRLSVPEEVMSLQ